MDKYGINFNCWGSSPEYLEIKQRNKHKSITACHNLAQCGHKRSFVIVFFPI